MNLQPYDKEFPPGGVIGARRRFWKQVYDEVVKIQKVQGDNVKLSESSDGTTIDVDLRAGFDTTTNPGGTPIGACCSGSSCVISTAAECGGVWHGGHACSPGYCASFLPFCGSCGFPDFLGTGRKFKTKTWTGEWAFTTGACGVLPPDPSCPDCYWDVNFDYLYWEAYDSSCVLTKGVDTCTGSNPSYCEGGFDPNLCGGVGGGTCFPIDHLDKCIWPGLCPFYYTNCDICGGGGSPITITEVDNQITTVTFHDCPTVCSYRPDEPGNSCSGVKFDAIFLSDECRTS